MENISKHITYSEATRSETAVRYGVSNAPNATQLAAMRYIAGRVFEPLRVHVGEPVRVSSFFRSPSVNALIPGASTTSQHLKGEAIDICRFAGSRFTNADLFWYIRENLEFDQLIWEHGTNEEPEWIHVSLKTSGNRRQLLQAYKLGGATRYMDFNLKKK